MNGALGHAFGADELVIERQALSGPLEIMALVEGPGFEFEVHVDARSWPAGRALG